MKLKRTLLITLALTIILSICLTGCKKNNQTNSDDEPPITQAYNEKIKSKVKGTGVGYWKNGDDEKYTIFTLERQEEYLINENYLNGKMFFVSSETGEVFNTTVTYDDKTVWAFSDLEITFNVDGDKMTLNVGDTQYVLNRVTFDDISAIRNELVAKLEKGKEEDNSIESNTNIESNNENPSGTDIEITTSNSGGNATSENPSEKPSDTPSQNTQKETPSKNNSSGTHSVKITD